MDLALAMGIMAGLQLIKNKLSRSEILLTKNFRERQQEEGAEHENFMDLLMLTLDNLNVNYLQLVETLDEVLLSFPKALFSRIINDKKTAAHFDEVLKLFIRQYDNVNNLLHNFKLRLVSSQIANVDKKRIRIKLALISQDLEALEENINLLRDHLIKNNKPLFNADPIEFVEEYDEYQERLKSAEKEIATGEGVGNFQLTEDENKAARLYLRVMHGFDEVVNKNLDSLEKQKKKQKFK